MHVLSTPDTGKSSLVIFFAKIKTNHDLYLEFFDCIVTVQFVFSTENNVWKTTVVIIENPPYWLIGQGRLKRCLSVLEQVTEHLITPSGDGSALHGSSHPLVKGSVSAVYFKGVESVLLLLQFIFLVFS